jgi:hypothetical protein
MGALSGRTVALSTLCASFPPVCGLGTLLVSLLFALFLLMLASCGGTAWFLLWR